MTTASLSQTSMVWFKELARLSTALERCGATYCLGLLVQMEFIQEDILVIIGPTKLVKGTIMSGRELERMVKMNH